MKKLSIWMSAAGAILSISNIKATYSTMTTTHVIYYLLMSIGYVCLMIYEIADKRDRERERVLNNAKVLNLQPGDKIIFKFNARAIRKSDIEKCMAILNNTFKGHEILAVSNGMEVTTAREDRGKNEDTTAEAKG